MQILHVLTSVVFKGDLISIGDLITSAPAKASISLESFLTSSDWSGIEGDQMMGAKNICIGQVLIFKACQDQCQKLKGQGTLVALTSWHITRID